MISLTRMMLPAVILAAAIATTAASAQSAAPQDLAAEQMMVNRSKGAVSSGELASRAMGDKSAPASAQARSRPAAATVVRTRASSLDDIAFNRAKGRVDGY